MTIPSATIYPNKIEQMIGIAATMIAAEVEKVVAEVEKVVAEVEVAHMAAITTMDTLNTAWPTAA